MPVKDERKRKRQREEGKLDEKRYSFASRASNPTEFLDDQGRLRTLLSAIRFFALKDVSRYTFVSRNTSIYKGVQFLRLGTTTSTTKVEYIFFVYIYTHVLVMADRTRWIRMYRFALIRIFDARYVVSSSTSRNESREREESAGVLLPTVCIPSMSERELSLSTRRRQKNTWERVSVSVEKVMCVLTFSETPCCLFRKYFSLLFRFIAIQGDRKKKRNSRSEEDREWREANDRALVSPLLYSLW